MNRINTKPFLSPADLEEMGLWTAARIRQKIHNKTMPIPYIKLDKEIRFRSSEVEKYAKSRTITQS